MPPAPTSTKTLTASTDDITIKEVPLRMNGIKQHKRKPSIKSTATLIAKSSTPKSPILEIAEETTDLVEVADSNNNTDEEAEELQIVWRNVLLFIYLHLAALYGGYLWVSGEVMWQTFIWGWMLYCMCGFGITAGAHRLWSHRSYKAKLPLRIMLCVFQTVAFQNDIYEWCRDHRVHHKFTETHADPHNSKRGFFFAHIGWLMCRKHENVKLKGKCVDMTDLEQDPVVVFQKKYYIPLVLSACFFIPTLVPYFLWGERFSTAWFFCAQFRYCITLHMTWLVNSAAHIWGGHQYDKTISPAENKSVAFWAFGEGWHNYHHVFPWDYKTAEIGRYRYNFSAALIDFMAWIGWAYDLKTVPKEIVKQRVLRTGDGTHGQDHDHPSHGPWGWGDKDIPVEDKNVTERIYTINKEEWPRLKLQKCLVRIKTS